MTAEEQIISLGYIKIGDEFYNTQLPLLWLEKALKGYSLKIGGLTIGTITTFEDLQFQTPKRIINFSHLG